ncbi:hypothetical protein [Halotia branconii]|uniref:Uncharacterized protein n=1 Tax=Halotia branconii CENA392 TaxID=1539056 RepID=A0AAJ6P830_9CYAN|nr:hypothetical protein [Halotia branconii]WGV24207.1 hypothetical protein QI031_20740 [Halotia branconii CENA392]
MTATITKPAKKSTKEKPQSPYKRLHVIIPIEDMLWASQQKPSVNQLWQECWTSDPYGSRWMPLSTALGYSSFICAKKILSESGLFIFKPDKSIQDGRETVGWMVRNLHGSRMKEFWEKVNTETQEANSTKQESNAENTEVNAGSEEMRCNYTASISDKTQSEQRFQKPSRTVQEHLTNSSVEFVRCVSTQDKNLGEDATADAPFRGASPQTLKSVEEEKEELPAVTDCTTLTLVEAVPSQSVSLLVKNEDLGKDAISPHEDTFSAAPADSNLENLNQPQDQAQPSLSASLATKNEDLSSDAIAPHEDNFSAAPVAVNLENLNQPQNQAQPNLSASLVVKNQNLVDEPGTHHEDTVSAAPAVPENSHSAPSSQEPKAHPEGVCAVAADSAPEKWSYEAVVERSRVRPWRMEKLKMAEQWRENPGDDFLMECWSDDPALRIVIKKLVIKCPHWGLVAADGVLLKWEG